jgi:hypothetical protein
MLTFLHRNEKEDDVTQQLDLAYQHQYGNNVVADAQKKPAS